MSTTPITYSAKAQTRRFFSRNMFKPFEDLIVLQSVLFFRVIPIERRILTILRWLHLPDDERFLSYFSSDISVMSFVLAKLGW